MVIATCRGNLVNNTMRVTCIMFHKIVAKSISDHRNPYNMGVLSNNDIKDRDMVALTKRILEHSQKGEIDYARRIYDQMNHRDCVSCNVMIRGYIKNHRTRDAREIFDRMHHRNTVSWNSMIMAYTHERKMHIALKFFLIMPDKDVISWTTIISGLCHDSQIEDAWQLFKQMPEPNSISWSSVISGFQQNGLAAETLILFKEMLSAGIHPTPHSFTSALTATADLAALSIGQQLYSQLIKRGFEINIHVGNSAISMFIKSGSFYDARHVFVVIPRPDTITWNSMLSGYAQHGYGLEAIMTFHQMQKAHIFPDGVSFLGVLQGCSHCGFVEEAWLYFDSMEIDHGIPPLPEHYACMVDVLARAGLIKEALDMILKMPFEPVAIFWKTLLNGCRIWGDLKLGVFAADKVLKLEPCNSSACLMVIEMYASIGRWVEISEIRRCMRGREARKELGYSWVEIKGKAHLFTTKDETHVASDSIYMILELLSFDVCKYLEIDSMMHC